VSVHTGEPLQPWEFGVHPPGYELPHSAHIGRVRLAVSSLEESMRFYSEVIGLAVYERLIEGNPIARLGAHGESSVLLELEELPGVNAIGSRQRLGLYHTAFLLPTVEDLSSFIRHLGRFGIRFGSADHLYSQALYLVDPDGLSVEVYADRPQEDWVYKGRELVTASEPLRFAELPRMPEGSWKGAPSGTKVGHVHLYIGDLDDGARFYHRTLGLNLMTWEFPGALFVSAGGYHHHVAINTWAAGSPVASDRDARLLFWELVLPAQEEIQTVVANMSAAGYEVGHFQGIGSVVVDPWGIRVALVTKQ
jgi:catechol 2,3-dioxygenase